MRNLGNIFSYRFDIGDLETHLGYFGDHFSLFSFFKLGGVLGQKIELDLSNKI
jgi:hypothetical protein